MRYHSTRGGAEPLGFADVLLAGLAPDGGLYVPERVPELAQGDLRALAQLTYPEACARLLEPFVAPSLSGDELAELAASAYATFNHPDVVPVTPFISAGPAAGEAGAGGTAVGEADARSTTAGVAGANTAPDPAWPTHLVELYWGPTFSFKDVALQLVGRLFEHVLARRGDFLTVVGATSGDTGSAAIEACRDRAGIQLVMLHPAGMVTEVQRRQMTTVDSPNIHNVAIDGTFDDCQDLVKALFADPDLRVRLHLGAVNSINPARVLAQCVYYATAALTLGALDRPVSFCVPTGNFGNVLAGHLTRRMGVPIEALAVATNHNDVLVRTHTTGTMALKPVVPSTSPAMDIAVSSNFERLLLELGGGDEAWLADAMAEFRASGQLQLGEEAAGRFRTLLAAGTASEQQVLSTIGRANDCGRLIDPHTAVGVHVATELRRSGKLGGTGGDRGGAVAVMSTAHPAKFAEAVQTATGAPPPMPEQLAGVLELPERCAQLPADVDAVRSFVIEQAAPR